MSVTPAMRPNCRSSGAATERRHRLGLAPGSPADTWMVGKSTCGSAATGSMRKPMIPASARPMVSNVVAIGRRMKGAEKFIRVSRGHKEHQ